MVGSGASVIAAGAAVAKLGLGVLTTAGVSAVAVLDATLITGTVVIVGGIGYMIKGIFSNEISEAPAEQAMPSLSHFVVLVSCIAAVVGMHGALASVRDKQLF